MKYIRLIIAVSMAVILVFQGIVYFWVAPDADMILEGVPVAVEFMVFVFQTVEPGI
ncbi:MAG: hypothetical protein HDR02_09820 [Lachnospiraceae bacterium]|nr:hypothetical protein [Lachnospiraceae bacterium]